MQLSPPPKKRRERKTYLKCFLTKRSPSSSADILSVQVMFDNTEKKTTKKLGSSQCEASVVSVVWLKSKINSLLNIKLAFFLLPSFFLLKEELKWWKWLLYRQDFVTLKKAAHVSLTVYTTYRKYTEQNLDFSFILTFTGTINCLDRTCNKQTFDWTHAACDSTSKRTLKTSQAFSQALVSEH